MSYIRIMKCWTPLILIGFISVCCGVVMPVSAQSSKVKAIDSLLQLADSDTQKAQQLEHLKAALSLAEKLPDSTLNAVHMAFGDHYLTQRDYDTAITYYLKILQTKSSVETKAQAHNNMAIAFKKQGRYTQALEFFKSAVELYAQLRNEENRAIALINAAQVCKLQGDLEQQIQLLYLARPILDQLKHKGLQSSLYYNLSNAHRHIKAYDKAIIFQRKAIALRTELGNKKGLANAYNSLGNIFREQRKFDSAIPYFQKAIKIKSTLNLPISLAVSYHSLGSVYAVQKDYDPALDYYNKAYKIRDSLNDYHGKAMTSNELAKNYIVIGDYALANYHLNTIQKWSETNSVLNIQLRTAELKKTYFQKLRQTDSLLHYSNKYLDLYKAYYEADKAKALLQLQEQYESKNKDELIDDLKVKEARLLQDQKIKDLKIKQRNLLLLIATVVIITVMVVFAYYRNRMKLRQIEAHQVGQEVIKQQVATALHDKVANKISGIRLKIIALINGNVFNKDHKNIANELGSLYENIRKLSHQLAPIAYHLERQTLTQALSNLFSDFERFRKIKLDVKGLGDSQLNQLKKQQQIALYCILEELLLNTFKHAKTKKVDLEFIEQKRQINIVVEDYGIGLPEHHHQGIGLLNIQTHIKILKGQFNIQNTGTGCKATLSFPKKPNGIK